MTLKYERTKKVSTFIYDDRNYARVTFRNLGSSEGCGNVCTGGC